MAGGLWGLWLGGLVRDADLDLPGDARGGLIECGGAPGARPIGIGGGFAAVLVLPLIDGMAADEAILAGTHSGRGGQPGTIGMSAAHELSHQMDGRRGSGRARGPSVIIVPPQHGQRSSRRGVTGSSVAADGATSGASSSFRQSASFAARWPLARKP